MTPPRRARAATERDRVAGLGAGGLSGQDRDPDRAPAPRSARGAPGGGRDDASSTTSPAATPRASRRPERDDRGDRRGVPGSGRRAGAGVPFSSRRRWTDSASPAHELRPRRSRPLPRSARSPRGRGKPCRPPRRRLRHDGSPSSAPTARGTRSPPPRDLVLLADRRARRGAAAPHPRDGRVLHRGGGRVELKVISGDDPGPSPRSPRMPASRLGRAGRRRRAAAERPSGAAGAGAPTSCVIGQITPEGGNARHRGAPGLRQVRGLVGDGVKTSRRSRRPVSRSRRRAARRWRSRSPTSSSSGETSARCRRWPPRGGRSSGTSSA